MNSGLEPDELSRLLKAAVEPIRPSAEAYQRIRAGVEQRPWWRFPLMAVGGVAMLALVGLAVVAIRPQSSNQVVEPAAPPLVSSMTTETVRPSSPAPGGSGSGGGNGGSGSTSPRTSTYSPPATATTAPSTATPSVPTATSTTGSGGAGALGLPTPATRPAGPNDVDGDGTADQVRFVGTPTRLEVVFSRGGVGTVDLPGLQGTPPHAVVDVDQDGFGEILVRSATRDGIDDYALVRYAAQSTLARVDFDSGVRLAAGMHDNTGFGFRCDAGRLEFLAGTSTDGSNFQLVTTLLQLTVDRLLAGASNQSQVTVSATVNPFQPDCGTLS